MRMPWMRARSASTRADPDSRSAGASVWVVSEGGAAGVAVVSWARKRRSVSMFVIPSLLGLACSLVRFAQEVRCARDLEPGARVVHGERDPPRARVLQPVEHARELGARPLQRALQLDQVLEGRQDLLRARALRVALQEVLEVEQVHAHLEADAVQGAEH